MLWCACPPRDHPPRARNTPNNDSIIYSRTNKLYTDGKQDTQRTIDKYNLIFVVNYTGFNSFGVILRQILIIINW